MSEAPEHLFRRLMARKGIDRLSIANAIAAIANLINLSGDLNREDGTARALKWCDDIQRRRLSPSDTALIDYFRANAWHNRQQIRRRTAVWAWEQPELQQEIFHLRRAISRPGFRRLPSVHRCQILTNLAGQLDTAGRFVDALEYWGRALQCDEHFGMALGNRGSGLTHYARSLYDPGHQVIFLRFAHEALAAALSPKAVYEADYADAKEFFRTVKTDIESRLNINRIKSIDLQSYSLGRSTEERRYRRWCLDNVLFLNPLNDLGSLPIAASDPLTLPSYVTPLGESPTLIGFFNQMKQEFASARWLLYEGLHSDKPHFSDRYVKLLNTLDYPGYGLAVEKVRAAFRITYSLLDKIAFFLNDYMRLDISRVYFRSIWYDGNLKNRALRPQFTNAENWPFRGLYWLAKDFVEEDFRDVMEPDAQALYDMRNRLEHSYLKVLEMPLRHATPAESINALWADRLAYRVNRSELEARTLRILKLVRAAIIYLALGMHREERLRSKRTNSGLLPSMALDTWRDTWKR